MEVFCFRLNPPVEARESTNNHKRRWAGPKSSRARENKQKCTGSRFPVSNDGNAFGLGWDRTSDAEETAIRFAAPRSVAGRPHGRRQGAPARRRPRVTTNPAAAAGPLMPDSPQLHHPPPPPAPPPPPSASSTPAASAAANAQPTLVKLRMIIKGVLGRYQRWNPVHPTAGAFWGVGLGLGCGVGWGPGFGPEVIGYVGAGCGVGFSVGFTLAGVGIGLPQHGLIRNHDHGGFASNVPVDSARFYAVTIIRGLVWDAISYAGNVVAMRKESRQKLLRFQDNPPVSGGVDLPKLGKGVSSSIQSTVECIRAFKDQHWPP